MMMCPHCNTHIDEHGASRCLNAWIAEYVMGGVETMNFQEKSKCYWKFETPNGKKMLVNSKLNRMVRLWSPCTSIADAREVVEKWDAWTIYKRWNGELWYLVCLTNGEEWYEGVESDTPMLAICRAAIKATNE